MVMMKVCNLNINNDICNFELYNCSDDEFDSIIKYREWILKSWKKGNKLQSFVFSVKQYGEPKIVCTHIGFATNLIRHLENDEFRYMKNGIVFSTGTFKVNGKKLFEGKNIFVGPLYYSLWDFQREAVDAWYNNLGFGIIKSPTGCLTGDSIVFTNKGLITIKELYNEKYYDVKVMNYSGIEVQYNEIDNYFHYENKDIVYIRTKFGFELRCTPEHKIVCVDKEGVLKYIEAKELKIGNVVPISYGYNCFGKNVKMGWDEKQTSLNFLNEAYDNITYGGISVKYGHDIKYPYFMNEELAEFLGYYVSEGNISGGSVIITNTDKKINERTEYLFKKIFNCNCSIKIKENNDYGRVAHSVGLIEFLSLIGLDGKSREKNVPSEILKSSKEVYISFLKAVFSGDGYVENDKKDVGYSSLSKNLCKQIQLMLMNLDIFSTLTEKDAYCNGKYCGKSYAVTMYGNNVLKFRDLIGFIVEYRSNDLSSICENIENRDRWTSMTIPNIHMMIKEIDDIARRINRIYVKDRYDTVQYSKFLTLHGFKGINMWCDGRRTPSKEMLRRILSMYSNIPEIVESDTYNYLMTMCEFNVEYDEIECIEKRGKEDVYDIAVKNIPHYISNGYIVHNSGKGVMACEIIRRTSARTLILVHTSDLLINVWLNTLVEQFSEGIKGRIGIIGGGLTEKDRKYMRMSSDCSFDANINKSIVIATSQSMLKKLNLLRKQRFGLLIVDEVHHYSSEQFKNVTSAVSAPMRLGLSATLNRTDGTAPLFFGLLGDICYSVGIRDLVEKGILVDPLFETHIVNDSDIQSEIVKCGLQQLELSRYIKKMSASSVIKKNYIINSLVKRLYLAKQKFIMYTDYVTPVDGVYTRDDYVKEISSLGIRVYGVSSELSGNQRERLFNDLKVGNLDGLIFGALGSEGVNIPAVDSVIMCNTTASPIRFPQRVGRAMRSIRGNPDKKFAYIYEVCLNIGKELDWSKKNFYEYRSEGYYKNEVTVKSKDDMHGAVNST